MSNNNSTPTKSKNPGRYVIKVNKNPINKSRIRSKSTPSLPVPKNNSENIPLVKPKVTLAKPNIPLPKPKVTLAKPKVTLAKPRAIPLNKPKMNKIPIVSRAPPNPPTSHHSPLKREVYTHHSSCHGDCGFSSCGCCNCNHRHGCGYRTNICYDELGYPIFDSIPLDCGLWDDHPICDSYACGGGIPVCPPRPSRWSECTYPYFRPYGGIPVGPIIPPPLPPPLYVSFPNPPQPGICYPPSYFAPPPPPPLPRFECSEPPFV